jgi:serine/threonine protein kinase
MGLSRSERILTLVRLIESDLASYFRPNRPKVSFAEDDQRVEPRLDLLLLRYPELQEDPQVLLGLAVSEYTIRLHAGNPLDLAHYERSFPRMANRLIPMLQRISEFNIHRLIKESPIARVDTGKKTECDFDGQPEELWKLPKQLGVYHLVSLHGSGGMGSVYRAIDLRTGALVAVKVTRRQDAWSSYRFFQEFQTLSSLEHPNLVRLHEAFSVGSYRCFSMDLVRGQTLSRWWMRAKKLPQRFDLLRSLLEQLAGSIHYLHQHDVLHGDIKPANILVSSGLHLTLLDFGLASFLSDRSLEGVVAFSKTAAGTVGITAPEVLAGQTGTRGSDWFSFAAMTLELLQSEHPAGNSEAGLGEREGMVRSSGWYRDLWDLCQQTVKAAPVDRADAQAFLQCLQSGHPRPASIVQAIPSPPQVWLPRSTDSMEQQWWERMREDRTAEGWVLAAQGPQGAGKSFWFKRWQERLAAEGFQVVALRCNRRDRTPGALLHHWRQRCVQIGLPLEAGPASDSIELNDPLLEPSATEEQKHGARLAQEITAAWRRLTESRALVIAIDQMEWIDPISRFALESFALRRGFGSGGMVLACRDRCFHLDSVWNALRHGTQSISAQRLLRLTMQPVAPHWIRAWIQQWLTRFQGQRPEIELWSDAVSRLAEGYPGRAGQLVQWEAPQRDWRGEQWNESFDRLNRSTYGRCQYRSLASDYRHTLQYLAASWSPLEFQQLQMATRFPPEHLARILDGLAANWLEWSEDFSMGGIRIASDVLRIVVIESTDPELMKKRHHRLAAVVSRETPPHWDSLIYHYRQLEQPVLVSVTLFQAAQSAFQQGDLAQATQWARQIDWRLLPGRLVKEAVDLRRLCDIPATK